MSASAADAVFVDDNTVRQAQKTLNDRGYRTGGVDGKMGPQTQAALVKFSYAGEVVFDVLLGLVRRRLGG